MEVETMELLKIEQNGETCIICNELKNKGIHLYTTFICIDCEQKMISTEPEDPNYKYYLKKLRKINENKFRETNLTYEER